MFNAQGNVLIEHLRTYANGREKVTILNEFNKTTLEMIASVIIYLFCINLRENSLDFSGMIYTLILV